VKIWLPIIATGTGAEVYFRRLAAGLAARGHDVHLDLAPHRYQYAPWLAGLRAPAGVEVTVANSWSAAAFAGPAPLVTVVHHVVHDPNAAPHKSLAQLVFHRGFVLPMERRAVRISQAVIAVSRTTARAIRAYLADVPVDIVLNGIDTAFFCPAGEPSQHDRAEPLELLFVGKPSRRKGFDLIAEIVRGLGDAGRLTCIGPPPEPGLPRPPGRYLGRVSDEALRAAYREADLLLFPSRLEGFGYAAAEALACGLPVVCAEGGAVAEIAPPPDCGIACPADDPDAFIAAIRALKADPPRLAAMRQQARAHAVARLDARRWIEETEAVLRRVVLLSGAKPTAQTAEHRVPERTRETP
jgi:glycosyltransferase involved in cell wall biosynthesis